MYVSRQARPGFSLMEILIALAIISILGAIAIPAFLKYRKDTQMTSAKATLRTLSLSVESYNTDTGQWPEALQDLIRKPISEEVAKDWSGPYIKGKDVPRDPWKHTYHYAVTPGQEHPYELYSYGPNGKAAPQSEWISVWNL